MNIVILIAAALAPAGDDFAAGWISGAAPAKAAAPLEATPLPTRYARPGVVRPSPQAPSPQAPSPAPSPPAGDYDSDCVLQVAPTPDGRLEVRLLPPRAPSASPSTGPWPATFVVDGPIAARVGPGGVMTIRFYEGGRPAAPGEAPRDE